jgi:acyl CoA:acetate/3-ketoacid CoA transferase beta subunit
MRMSRRADIIAVAIADSFRGDGESLCNPIGPLPLIGGRLARRSFEPDLAITDGFYTLLANTPPVGVEPVEREIEHWNPYRSMFSLLWRGRRHVMMGASQVDRYGNQNIAAIGDWHQPKAQLLGFRGAPGNTINHTTSYWVPNHSPKSVVAQVDVVCGIGYDRAAELGAVARFHEIRRVVTNLGTFDFSGTDADGVPVMTLRTFHPWSSVEEITTATAFELEVSPTVGQSRLPTPAEAALLDEVDPTGVRFSEVKDD